MRFEKFFMFMHPGARSDRRKGAFGPLRPAPGPAARSFTRHHPGEAVTDALHNEKSKRKAVIIRACIYTLGTHLFAGFVMLLFAIGNHRH